MDAENILKLLVVEDDAGELGIWESSRKRYEKENKRKVEIVTSRSLAEAREQLDNSFDGAIVDLKLGNGGDVYDGNNVVKEIQGSYRIPVAILSGNPSQADVDESTLVGFYIRGEIEFVDVISDFFNMFDTGLTKIFGGRGVIETVMDSIFWESILPVFNKWRSYAAAGSDTEVSLLRYTMSHLLDMIDVDADNYYPEEMYIVSTNLGEIKTGNIIKHKETGEFFVVLSPACDLAIRKNGGFKTDRILVVQIEKQSDNEKMILEKGIIKSEKSTTKQKKHSEREIQNLIRNNSTNYYHYLPATDIFEGGVINFRKINSYTLNEFSDLFSTPVTRIVSSFLKDIIARFSSFYARQGQPDFDSEHLMSTILK